MSNPRYGAEDYERQAGWRGDRDREDDRRGASFSGREREVGRDHRSFSGGPGGDPYGDYGQGSERFLGEGGYRHGYGHDPDGAGGMRRGTGREAYEGPRGDYRGGRSYGGGWSADVGYGENFDYGAGARSYRDREGSGGSGAQRGPGLGPDNPMLANLADGHDAGSGLHRGRGPKNYVRSDERIREDISDRLADDPHLDASDIEVQVQNGEVTLTGTVDHRQSKRRAEDRAEDVSGVKHLQNNLRVRDSLVSSVSGTNAGSATPSRTHN